MNPFPTPSAQSAAKSLRLENIGLDPIMDEDRARVIDEAFRVERRCAQLLVTASMASAVTLENLVAAFGDLGTTHPALETCRTIAAQTRQAIAVYQSTVEN